MSLLKTVAGHRLTKQAGKIIFYVGLSRLAAVAGTIWAVRCLGPQNNGISTSLGYVLAWVSLFVGCSLDNLLIRRYKHAATEEERRRLVELALSQRFFFSLILGVAGIPVAWLLLRIFRPAGEWWLGIWAAVPLLVLTSIQPNWVNIAQEDLPVNYKASTIAGVFAALAYFLFFRPGQPAGSDLVVVAAQMVLQFVILWRATFKRLWPLPIRWRAMREFWPVLSEGRWMFITGMVIYVYISLDVIMLGWFSSEQEVGKYGAAVRLVNSAQQVLGMVPLLLFPRFVEWRKQGVEILWRKQMRLCAIFLALAVPLCGLVFVLSPLIFRLLCGAAFAESAYPFAVLFASKMMVVLNGFFAQGLWAQSEDRKVFWVLVPTAVVSLVCNLLLLPRYGMYAACWINLLSEFLVLIGCFILARRHLKQVLAKAASPETLPTPIQPEA